jgi:FkbM family methyltransferase
MQLSSLRKSGVSMIESTWQPAAALYLRGRYALQHLLGFSEAELELLPKLVRPGSMAIDVGANTGIYSYYLHRLGQRVRAFEPNPRLARLLEEAKFPGVEVINAGLSDTPGKALLHIPVIRGRRYATRASLMRPSDACETVEVDVATLDSFAFENVGLIKIDVEGNELRVLAGGRATIERNRPALIVELSERTLQGVTLDEAFRAVIDLNYQGFFYLGKELLPLSKFSKVEHQDKVRHKRHSRVYIRNFIFLPDKERRP